MRFIKERWMALILTVLSFMVIILSSFTAPIESDYERFDRIKAETEEMIRNTSDKGITKFFVRGESDGRIEIRIWATRGFAVDEYHLVQSAWLDSYGNCIEQSTWRGNRQIETPIIDFT